MKLVRNLFARVTGTVTGLVIPPSVKWIAVALAIAIVLALVF